jgi:hypothetical protein
MRVSSPVRESVRRAARGAGRSLAPGAGFAAIALALLALGIGASASRLIRQASPASAIAITNVRVVDVRTGDVQPNRTVLILGGRIDAVGRAAETRVPPGARVVDGSGKYLIPGLWDMHTHVTGFGRAALPLLLAHGVTGVRDMGARHFAEARGLRDSIAAGHLLGPRVRIASPVVEHPDWLAAARRMGDAAGTPWTLYERFGPSSVDEAVAWVDSVAALGADHLKVRNWPAEEVGRALVARAAQRGLPLVAHPNRPFIARGIATFEHGVWPPLADATERARLWATFEAEGTAFVPTLVTLPAIRFDPPDTLIARIDRGTIRGLEYVPAETRDRWRDQLREMAQEVQGFDFRGLYRDNLRDLVEMHLAGVTIMAGTDLGAPALVPGVSLHDELERLVRDAGLTPLQALQAATLFPARAMGIPDAGGIAPGNVADLVLLDRNPLEGIDATRRISAVVAAGRLLDRHALVEQARGTTAPSPEAGSPAGLAAGQYAARRRRERGPGARAPDRITGAACRCVDRSCAARRPRRP